MIMLIFFVSLVVIGRCEKVEIESIAPLKIIIPYNTTNGSLYDWYSSLSVLNDKDKQYIFMNNLIVYDDGKNHNFPVKMGYNMNVYDNYGNQYNELNYLFPYTPTLYKANNMGQSERYINTLDSCTSPSNNNIITCYLNDFEFECLLLSKNNIQIISKKWQLSPPQTVFTNIDSSDTNYNPYSIQTICVSDGYLVFLFCKISAYYNSIIQYNLLDLHLNEIQTFGVIKWVDPPTNYTGWTFTEVLQQTKKRNNLLFEAPMPSRQYVGVTAKYHGMQSKNALYVSINNISFNMPHLLNVTTTTVFFQQQIVINVNDNCCYMTPYWIGQRRWDDSYYIGLTTFDGHNVLQNDFIFNVSYGGYDPNSFSISLNMLQNNNEDSMSKYFLLCYGNDDHSVSGIVFKIDYYSANNKYILQNVSNPITLINSSYPVYWAKFDDNWAKKRNYKGIIANNKLFLLWRNYPNGILVQSFSVTLIS